MLILIVNILIFLLILYIFYYPPKSLFDILQRRNPDVLFQLPLPFTSRVVALTIDDSPSPYTSTILDSLKTHNAKATFFIIGDQVPGYEHILQRIISEGHEVGNHAWSDEKTILRPLWAIEKQIKAVDALLPANENGLKYFRPGGGFFNSGMVERVKKLGYRTVLGCIFPHDPQIWSPWVNSRHVLSMVREGGIIILHDRRGHSAPQLEMMLEGLGERRWEVVSLGGLIEVADRVKGKKSG